MNRLLLTIPYCTKDHALASQLLRWMGELQPTGYKPHSVLILADTEVPMATRKEIFALAKPMFAHAAHINVPVPPDKQGWINGSNYMFHTALESIYKGTKLPWLWCEPDCVPLREGWLDALAQGYADSPQRFMGCHVTQAVPQEGMPPIYLSGCAIYDTKSFEDLGPFAKGPQAFDIASAAEAVPRSHNSPLFQYWWGLPDLAPTFREVKGASDPENTIPMGFFSKKAVLFHRCKDGTLIDCLRKRREKGQIGPVNAMTLEIQTPKKSKEKQQQLTAA